MVSTAFGEALWWLACQAHEHSGCVSGIPQWGLCTRRTLRHGSVSSGLVMRLPWLWIDAGFAAGGIYGARHDLMHCWAWGAQQPSSRSVHV